MDFTHDINLEIIQNMLLIKLCHEGYLTVFWLLEKHCCTMNYYKSPAHPFCWDIQVCVFTTMVRSAQVVDMLKNTL